jgi:tetratricopeptide (TPR) repeat protein
MNDDTTTKGTDPGGITQTASATPLLVDDLTQEISMTSTPTPATVQDILFHSVEDPLTPRTRPEGEMYTHEGDIFVKRQAQDTARWVWAITAIVITVAVTFVVFRQFVAKPILDQTVADESTQAAVVALDEGDYTKALELFNRAYTLDPNNTSIYLYLGILKIQVEEQPVHGRQLLEKLRNKEDRDLKRVLTGIGLGYLKEGDLKNAEDYFNKALDVDPLFLFPTINLGSVALIAEDWAKAANHLQLAIKDGGADGTETLLLAQAFIKLYEKEKEKRYLNQAREHLQKLIERSRDYRQEAMLADAYIEFVLTGQAPTAPYAFIDAILEVDPYETEAHKHHIFIARDKVRWNILSQWCLKLTQDLDPTSRVVALEGYCLLRAGDWAEASRKLDDALAQAPKDPLTLAAYSYVLKEMNSIERSVVMADKAISYDVKGEFVQPLRMRAYLCQNAGGNDCEKRLWPEVLKQDSNSLAALAGMARILHQAGEIKESKKHLVRGLNISERYRPFYTINRAISQSEDLQKSRGL